MYGYAGKKEAYVGIVGVLGYTTEFMVGFRLFMDDKSFPVWT